jgi:hypothetical protein
MAALDFIKTIYDKHWLLLENHAPWAAIFAANNRIKLRDDVFDPFKRTLNDGDFPQFGIGVGEISDTGYTLTQHYGYQSASGSGNSIWTERIIINFAMTIVMPDLRLTPANMAVLETLVALRGGGPRFGNQQVASWGPLSSQRNIMSDKQDEFGNPAGTKRLVITITNPVMMQYHGNQLI